jgi:tetratricopeptide (TPR) repeat protein
MNIDLRKENDKKPQIQVVNMLIDGTACKKICCGLVCVTVFLLGGCGTFQPFAPAKVESLPSPAEMQQYQQATAEYQQKNYIQAAESFEAIRTQTRDKRFALTALYGLALSKLMAAKTPKEYNDAVQLWQRWVDNVPDNFTYENPVLASSLIQDKMLFSNIPLSTEMASERAKQLPSASEKVPDPMVSRWLLIKSKLELDRLRNELEASNKALEKRKKTIRARNREIKELKRRFEALENIDQKIQEKKNAIPSTDSATPRN